ncbi:MAG: heliorhodopsin HeR [bacterium]
MGARKAVAVEAATYRRLRLWNLGAGVSHLAQGVIMVMLASSWSIPVNTNYAIAGADGPPAGESQTVQLVLVRLGLAVSVFLFMSAIAHFAVSAPGINAWYVRNLKNHVNYARWIEYAFSASWMLVLIAMLSGMYDLSSLILLGVLNATMLLFGLLMEHFNKAKEKVDWLPFYFGCISWVVPWVTVFLYFTGAQGPDGSGPPAFVYGIVISLFVFFSVFALNMVLQYKRWGKWKDYLFGEKVYIILSLTAKAVLAWQVFAGTLG